MKKLLGVLKYIGKTIILTLLTIIIIVGLALLFVFVSTKVAQKQGKNPPVNLYTIISPSMTPNINVYDVVVSVLTKPEQINAGDVITFYSDNPNLNGMTVTHRVIQRIQNGDNFSYQTKGDYNKLPDTYIVPASEVVGKVIFKVPQLGKVQFFLASSGGWIIAILIPALAIIAYDIYKIIKLILIKQKIINYKKEEDIETHQEDIVTIDDIYRDEEMARKEEMNQSADDNSDHDDYIPRH